MNMMIYPFEWLFLFLFAVVCPLLYSNLASYKKKRLYATISIENLSPVATRNWLSFTTKALCLVVAGCLLSIAFMKWSQEVNVAPSLQATSKPTLDEVAFIVDLSRSMNAADASGETSRIARAKEIIEAVVENLGGIHVSLTAFTGSPQRIVSATEDYLYLRILLESLHGDELPVAGTNLAAMCEMVQKEYVDNPVAKSVQIILLTDGEDTGFLGLGTNERARAEEALIDLVSQTRSKSLRWNVVALGTEKGGTVPGVIFEGASVVSSMRPALLKQIAEVGGGQCLFEGQLSVDSIVDNILAQIAVQQSQDKRKAAVATESSPSYFPIVGALFLILVALAIPERV